jgi:hypothetical protein
MGIRDMVVGGKYLAGDSIGYDVVECLEVNPKDTPIGFYGVKIKYLDSGAVDVWFENNESMFTTYVEPYFER